MKWQDILAFFTQKAFVNNLIASVIFVIIVLIARAVVLRGLSRRAFESDEVRLRWHVRLRNTALVFMLLGLIAIWAAQLQTFAISAVAFVAAMVVATKELIMCISGGFLRMAGDSFAIGDRIEVGSSRGEVINIGFLTTTLLEIGPGHQRTGRALILPNSVFVNSTVINETFTDNYVLHIVSIPIAMDHRWEQAERILLECAQNVCQDYLELAYEHLNKVAKKHALVPSQVEPRVLVQVTGKDSLSLMVRFPTPAREKGRHEQDLIRQFLRNYQALPALDPSLEEVTPVEGTDEDTTHEDLTTSG